MVAAVLSLSACGAGAGAPLPSPADPAALRVTSFNIHYLWRQSSAPMAHWEQRQDAVVSVLRQIDPDLVGFQEMETFAGAAYNPENRQMDTLAEAFPHYRFSATGDPARFPNTQPIMYHRGRLDPLGEGFFFFSPHPDTPYGDPWFGPYPAFATWARFGDLRSGETVLVFNVHIDRKRRRNRILSAELLASRVNEVRRPSDRVVVLGDFNALRWMRPVRIVERTSGLRTVTDDGATFHFGRGIRLFPAIDHVLLGPRLTADGVRAVRSRPGGVWPSDHFPIVADVRPVPR